MEERSPYLPARTVVKFYDNHDPTNSNKIMTKTLMKVAFVDNDWLDRSPAEAPKDGEFWLVDIVDEKCPGEPRGCFLLHPIRKIEANQLNRLLPGMYEERAYGGCLILEPKSGWNQNGGIHWLLPLRHKKSIREVYAVIVVH